MQRKLSPDELAHQYLTLGRVSVLEADVGAQTARCEVRSRTKDTYYTVTHRGRWQCNCPAMVGTCAHIRACKKVLHFMSKPALPQARDLSLDEMLSVA